MTKRNLAQMMQQRVPLRRRSLQSLLTMPHESENWPFPNWLMRSREKSPRTMRMPVAENEVVNNPRFLILKCPYLLVTGSQMR